MDKIGNSFVTIDMDKIVENMEKIKRHVGPDVTIMPVLKANACGHGLVPMARLLVSECGIERLAVALTREARQLREAGIDTDIMVLGGLPENNIAFAVRENLVTPAFSSEDVKKLSQIAASEGKNARVHVKVDTGLGRIGVRPGEELDSLISSLLALPNIEIEGVYTHFAQAEVLDPSFTNEQIARFDLAVEQMRSRGVQPKYIHATNSPSTVRFKNACYNMVRTGLLWLGYDPCMDEKNKLGLKTVLEWRAFVTSVREIALGESIGYCRSFTASRNSKVAIGSFGYGDGYLEDLGKKGGYVLIRGQRAPLVSVCMDQTFIDVTDVDGIRSGDVITLIGRDGDEYIDAFDLEKITENSYVFYLSNINERPVKTYIRRQSA